MRASGGPVGLSFIVSGLASGFGGRPRPLRPQRKSPFIEAPFLFALDLHRLAVVDNHFDGAKADAPDSIEDVLLPAVESRCSVALRRLIVYVITRHITVTLLND
jgi:hypothetical protein